MRGEIRSPAGLGVCPRINPAKSVGTAGPETGKRERRAGSPGAPCALVEYTYWLTAKFTSTLTLESPDPGTNFHCLTASSAATASM